MPGCSIEREVIGGAARYRVSGKFESACAWELASRLEQEPLGELTLDFSQCGEFVDYGVAVLSSALLSISDKCVHLEGLRHHQIRLFKYFGVDADQIDHRRQHRPLDREVPLASEVA